MNTMNTVESNRVVANILAAAAAIMMLAMIVAALALAACRQPGDPASDPTKTAPNSPFPELDRKDPDPKSGPPSLTSADAG
jgi:hypothetical protein